MARVHDSAGGFVSTVRRALRRLANGHPDARPAAPTTNWVDDLVDIGRRIPPEDRARLPTDGARNFDHYLDGSPRQE